MWPALVMLVMDLQDILIWSPFLRAVGIAILASVTAILYSESLFQWTKWLYLRGKLLRYFPLPENRNILWAFANTLSFTVPVAFYATYFQGDIERSWNFNPLSIYGNILLYMLLHDAYFFHAHLRLHKSHRLYETFHLMHHDYTHAMNVFAVTYAEISENFIQVGLPWVCWTWFAGSNVWNWLLPFTLTGYTTLVGHGGYKSSPYIACFYPLIVPLAFVLGKHMLTAGNHQTHHSHRRYNYALFFRGWDQLYGTFRKTEIIPHDVDYWKTWLQDKSNSEQGIRWMGKGSGAFIEWGF
ncbi:hypothetical protein O988_05877 [Pseudogymnoascus sp. VKM F-3808]|nr:hypothetical protein O988_05877 [Pseudogymnoascus sp. VKM F-3808]